MIKINSKRLPAIAIVLVLALQVFAVAEVGEAYAENPNISVSAVADFLPYPELPNSVIPDKNPSDWSLINLILSAIAALSSIALIFNAIICYRRKKNGYEIMRDANKDDGCTSRDYTFRDMGIVFGLVTPLVWVLVDIPFERMVLVNNRTICVALLFVVHVVFATSYIIDKEKREENDEIGRESW
jgi:hypothetical protein